MFLRKFLVDGELFVSTKKTIYFAGTKGDILYVGRAKKKPERRAELEAKKQERLLRFQNVNLYVKNLDQNVTVDDLREAFSQHGTITSVKVKEGVE